MFTPTIHYVRRVAAHRKRKTEYIKLFLAWLRHEFNFPVPTRNRDFSIADIGMQEQWQQAVLAMSKSEFSMRFRIAPEQCVPLGGSSLVLWGMID